MEYADDEDFMDDNAYDRIVIDFRADWNANSDGEFGRSSLLGFQYSTIYVPDDVRITINLNGKTINRGLTEWEYDGEVMYIDDDADVIINNGTIKGGNSCNGAGGIHIMDDAKVTLNNVNIVGNIADDDDGGGIALYDGAELIVNGGSFEGNVIDGNAVLSCYGGAVYVNNAKASFYGVTFKNNYATWVEDHGAAIYADDSEVYIENCTFDGNCNELLGSGSDTYAATSVIYGDDSSITIKGSKFINNGVCYYQEEYSNTGAEFLGWLSSIITLEGSTLTVEDTEFSNNASMVLIFPRESSHVYVTNSTFKDNNSCVLCSYGAHYDDSYFRNCSFNNNLMTNTHLQYLMSLYRTDLTSFCVSGGMNFSFGNVTFYDCDMGNSTYANTKLLTFVDSDAPNGAGSIFGEGSMPMLLAMIAIVVSIGSVCTTVILFKKKAVPAKAGKATETVDEE